MPWALLAHTAVSAVSRRPASAAVPLPLLHQVPELPQGLLFQVGAGPGAVLPAVPHGLGRGPLQGPGSPRDARGHRGHRCAPRFRGRERRPTPALRRTRCAGCRGPGAGTCRCRRLFHRADRQMGLIGSPALRPAGSAGGAAPRRGEARPECRGVLAAAGEPGSPIAALLRLRGCCAEFCAAGRPASSGRAGGAALRPELGVRLRPRRHALVAGVAARGLGHAVRLALRGTPA